MKTNIGGNNMEINEKRLINSLKEMIKINSVSLKEKPMADWLQNYFETRGELVYRDDAWKAFSGNCGNLLVHIEGNMEGEAICFMAHMDTVEPGENIQPIIEEDKMVSEGSTVLGADDKSGIAAVLEAYECIRENKIPHRELYFLFTVCEEIGMLGVKNFECSKLTCKNVVVVDAAGAPGVIAYAAPAMDNIKVTFKGKKAHGGIEPEKGINAIYMAAMAINNMKLGRIDEETTSNIGRIEGGGPTNIVTDKASFTAEVRSHSIEKLKLQVELMRKVCEDAAKKFNGQVVFENRRDYPNLKLDRNTFIFQHCEKSYEKENIKPNPIKIGGGSDGNILAGKGYQCAIISCGMYDVHTTEESLVLNEIYATAKAIARMMTE